MLKVFYVSEVMTTIAIMNQKGGVGKTTTTLNLSAAIQCNGGSPLMVDMDPQSHLSSIHPSQAKGSEATLFGFYQNNTPLNQIIIEWDNVGKLICSHMELAKVETSFGKGPSILNRLKVGLKHLESIQPVTHTLIDCSPNMGVLTLSAIFAADIVIIPISSDFLSVNGARKIEKTLNSLESVLKKRVERRYLLTKYDTRRHMSSQVFNIAKTYFGNDVFDVVINENVDLAKSAYESKDIFSYNARCTGALNYKQLYDDMVKQNLI